MLGEAEGSFLLEESGTSFPALPLGCKAVETHRAGVACAFKWMFHFIVKSPGITEKMRRWYTEFP